MGLKAGIFSETLILCVFLILDTRNIASGCKLFYPGGNEVDLTVLAGDTAFVGEEKISDDRPPGPLYTFSAENITSIDLVSEEETKYLDYEFNGTTLTIKISDNYTDWKKIEDETFTFFLRVDLQLDCIPQRVEFRAQITQFKNKYPPELQDTNYKIKLPMPLPAGYTIVGKCGEVIEATDYDYNSQYKSGVIFSLRDPVEDLEVTTLEREGKKWGVSLKTKNTFKIEEPLTIALVAEDVAPDGVQDPVLKSEVSITIEPDIEASTPASPLFSEPIYILDIREEEDIKPIKATLVEGYSVPYKVELVHSHGENLKEFFETSIEGAVVTLTRNMSFADTEFSGNFGVLILEAKHPDSNETGKTVIHVTLPGNYVTPPPTSTTETTILSCSCPTEETTYTTDTTKTTEEITQCPEVTSPTEVTCPEVTCATEPTILPCTCPTEETTFTSDTTKPTEESTFITDATTDTTKPTEETTFTSDTTKPTEESTFITDATTDTTKPTEESTFITDATTDTTKPTEEGTQCPEITSPAEVTTPCPEVTCATETTILSCTYPPTIYCPTEEPTSTSPSTSGTTESCVCTTENTSVSNEGSTTTTVNTNTCEPCEPCDCTSGTPEPSAAPPQEKRIYFRDPQAIVYVYEQQKGYIKTMSAFCIPDCKIEYEIVAGPLSDSLHIDRETGNINITENIKESGPFDVMAVAEIGGNNYNETATVHLNVLTLQSCQNGSQWINTLAVKHVQEELESPYTVEKCDYMDGCGCEIVEVIPDKARGYFIDGTEVVLNKAIDREDKELFPDQSNTYIILHLELKCESDVKTTYKFWDKRSRSVIDEIGTIKYDALRTVIVLGIEDVNDNRPQFNITSPLTVGYPNAETANQLLPPYLMKIQATDADFGENAIIEYHLTPDDEFFIHQETGVIYPVAGGLRYEDTNFTVYARDSVDDGEPLVVNVKILSDDNLVVIRQTGSVLEDVDAVIEKISSITEYNIKLLSAAVIASDIEDDDRQLRDVKSVRESSNSLLQLIIYGLDSQEKPIHYSDIKKQLEGETDFTSESWTASISNNNDDDDRYGSSDTGLLIAVIILAVIILLLLGGAGVAYLLYARSRRNNNDDYYEKIMKSSDRSSTSKLDENEVPPATEEKSDYVNLQSSSSTEVIQPSPPALPHLSGVITTKPDQERGNMIVLDDFDSKSTSSNGDVGENEEEGNYENVVTRKKSVVTFNDNVERIEIEEI